MLLLLVLKQIRINFKSVIVGSSVNVVLEKETFAHVLSE